MGKKESPLNRLLIEVRHRPEGRESVQTSLEVIIRSSKLLERMEGQPNISKTPWPFVQSGLSIGHCQ